MAGIYRLCSAALLFCTAVPAASDTHSLFYTYTALSKPVDLPGIYEFIALGSLDDRELDYYNSQTQVKVPRLKWMKEQMAKDYWEKGTQSRVSKEQWFKVNVEILIKRMRHNETDLHVLQWRHGCVIKSENGKHQFLQGIDEYSYDGAEFLSFDGENSRWIAPVQAAEETKRKWDGVDILNQYTKSYLEKECVDWLTKFISLGQEELKQHSPPDVHFFVKKSVRDSKQMTLTCLATGFFSKDVQVRLGKGRTFIPEHLITSSGVRPNGDGTYQLRKSLEIQENEKAMYDCQVSHSSLKEPITVSSSEDIKCLDCSVPMFWGATVGLVVGILLSLAVIACVMVFLLKTGKIVCRGNDITQTTSETAGADEVFALSSSPEAVLTSPPAPVPERNIFAGKICLDLEKDSGAGSSKGSEENLNEETSLLSDSDSALASTSSESQQNIPQNVEHKPPV